MKVIREERRGRPGSIPTIRKNTVCEISEATYTGNNMSDRQIVATIKSPTVIDFHLGDYIEVKFADLLGGWSAEKFYIYTQPVIKKNASSGNSGDAFEITVTFYPAQYELQNVKMRDIMQQSSAEELTSQSMIYTGYDSFSFYGGAHLLLDRIMAVLNYSRSSNYWSYVLSNSLDEYTNQSLENYQFDFSDNSVMEAVQKLSDEEGLRAEWFINGRTIYVGFPKPHVVGFDKEGSLIETPFLFEYGKTSHLPITHNAGNLYSITKSEYGDKPITRLYAYGAERNLNRYYCSDIIRSGRYVSKLMLPSFSTDGKTDYLESQSGIDKYGVVEGSKQFEEIFPTLKGVTYGDLRQIKYVIKIMGNGEDVDISDPSSSSYLSESSTFPVARVQCYKIIENSNGVNSLQEAFPPQTLAVFVHATGKTVKCTLHNTAAGQAAADYRVPMRNGAQIPGACFCVHDDGYKDPDDTLGEHTSRPQWFVKSDDAQITNRQINYTDDFWVTDVFVFEKYEYGDGENPHFNRDGYSAYCYPRINSQYPYYGGDTQLVNEIVATSKIELPDTDLSIAEGKQATFDIYLRDVGFKINEQNQFGSNVFVINGTFKINFYDGYLAGLDFDVVAANGNEMSDTVVPLYKTDGTKNEYFYDGAHDSTQAHLAEAAGAFWRLKCKRNTDNDYSWLPNKQINASPYDHIVFLEIMMPDIYIRAAENRLKREAEIYLEDVSHSHNQYILEFDKVRLAQIQQLGLQMREGVLLRIHDEDLGLYTQNEERTIADFGTQGSRYTNPMEVSNVESSMIIEQRYSPDRYKYYNKDFKYIIPLETSRQPVWTQTIDLPICTFHATTDENHIHLAFFLFYEKEIPQSTDLSTQSFRARVIASNGSTETEIRSFISHEYDGDIEGIYGYLPIESGYKRWQHVTEILTTIKNLQSGDYNIFIRLELSTSELNGGLAKFSYTDGDRGQAFAELDTYTYGAPEVYDGTPCIFEYVARTKYRFTVYLNSSAAIYQNKPINGVIFYGTDNSKHVFGVGNIIEETYAQYDQDRGAWRYVYTFELNLSSAELEELRKKEALWVVSYNALFPTSSGTTVKAGAGMPIICRTAEPYRFRSGKYYEVSFSVEHSEMLAQDMLGALQQFSLISNLSTGSAYIPDYKKEVVGNIYTYKFYLPTTFNNYANYYPSLTYIADGETEEIVVALLSIIEKNTEVEGEYADYVDLTIDQITIKLTDNSGDVGLGGHVDDFLREISATVKEKQKSTAWNILSNTVHNNTIEQSKQYSKINALSRKMSKQ